MKKILSLMFLLVLTLGAKAQFEKGTHFANASLTGLGIGFDKGEFSMGISAGYGYFISDCRMVGGEVGYRHHGGLNTFVLKPSFRYSFVQNGLNVGGGLQYEHAGYKQNYVQLCPQVGYTFFLSKNVSLEPAVYADFCLNDFSNGTSAGLKIGIGLYRGRK